MFLFYDWPILHVCVFCKKTSYFPLQFLAPSSVTMSSFMFSQTNFALHTKSITTHLFLMTTDCQITDGPCCFFLCLKLALFHKIHPAYINSNNKHKRYAWAGWPKGRCMLGRTYSYDDYYGPGPMSGSSLKLWPTQNRQCANLCHYFKGIGL